jgi:hypothetical protein
MNSLKQGWKAGVAWMRRFAGHPDPLVETSNWMAWAIGTHLPLWPLYLWLAAGRQVFPTALLTMALTPLFLVVPLLSRWNGLIGRIAMLLAGLANTVFTMWVLGQNTGTDLFFAPCAALAAVGFRHRERGWMLGFTLLPAGIFYLLQFFPLVPLRHFDARSAHQILILNALSIGVVIALLGWLQLDVYRRLERR